MSNECMSMGQFLAKPHVFLRPCPFCGSVPEIEEVNRKGGLFREKTTFFYVKCPMCRASSSVDRTKDKVARLWNRRVENE